MKRLYISAFILAMAVSACQEIVEPMASVSDGSMEFNLISPGSQTKAFGDRFVSSDKIGVFVTDYVDDETPMPLQVSGNRANNLSLTFDGTSWTPEEKVYWGTGKSDVYAYYPYLETVTDVNSQPFSVSLDQSTKRTNDALGGYEASDFLWAKATGVVQKDGAVNLAMKHILSKLTVKIVAGEDYIGSLPEDASVLLHSTVAAARVDLETGSAVKDPYAGAKSIQMNKLGIRKVSGVESIVYEAIVVPQMLQTTVPLFEINSKSVSYLVEDAFNFRPGVSYTYTITLNTSTNAIKVEIGCELEDWNSTGDDDEGEEGGSEGEDGEEGDDGINYTNLSSEGTANCYIVSEAGAYKYKAVQGNMDATVGNVKTVEVLWETFGTDVTPNVGDLVASTSYKDGYIRFTTPETYKEGNALIAAKNSAGTILWSWHIWFTDQPEVHAYDNQAGMMMDRNLGATSAEPGQVGTLGLLYYWGRKDPFMGSSSISESLDAASTGKWVVQTGYVAGNYIDVIESNPTTVYKDCGYAYGSIWTSVKTTSDPCPVGWQVPNGGENGFWAKADLMATEMDWDNMGMFFNVTYPGLTWYPMAGYRSAEGQLVNVGAVAIYSGHSGNEYARSMMFRNNEFHCNDGWWYNNMNYDTREAAFSVRCYREYDESLLPESAAPNISLSEAVNLSSKGTANSYIVSQAGTYSFPTVKGNSSESIGAAVAASVVWESFGTEEKPLKGDLISGAICENGMVYFKTADVFKEGNALIAAKDADGKILWSWHIWMTDEPKEQVYYNDAGIMMDRNLGAVNAKFGEDGVMGLRYQWGRKDPFMGEVQAPDGMRTLNSTYLWPRGEQHPESPLEYSISHPTVLMGWRNYGDWIYVDALNRVDNTRWQSEKTIYDPCPAGWRVPDGGEESVLAKAYGSVYGHMIGSGGNYVGFLGEDYIYYPNAGYYYHQFIDTGYWTITPHPRKNETADINILNCSGNNVDYISINMDWYSSRANRHYIRCQKE